VKHFSHGCDLTSSATLLVGYHQKRLYLKTILETNHGPDLDMAQIYAQLNEP
jgi:hypothetical protein